MQSCPFPFPRLCSGKAGGRMLTSGHKSEPLPSGRRVYGTTLSEGSRGNTQTREEGGSSSTHWSLQTAAAQKAKDNSSVSAGQSP